MAGTSCTAACAYELIVPSYKMVSPTGSLQVYCSLKATTQYGDMHSP